MRNLDIEDIKKKHIKCYPSLVEYSDFRQYLRDLFEYNKSVDSRYSLIKLSDELGVPYSNFKMIINGKRKLTDENLFAVINALRFNQEEKNFFETLVSKNQAKSKILAEYYEKKLDQSTVEMKAEMRHSSNRGLMNKWFFPPLILYILDILKPNKLEFDADLFKILSQKFPISIDDFRVLESIFQNPEIVSFSPDGKILLSFKKLNYSVVQEKYLRQVLEMHAKNLRNGLSNSTAISIKTEKIKDFHHEYNALLQKYVAMDLDENGVNSIAQITLNMTVF